jgi:hypothetical protein
LQNNKIEKHSPNSSSNMIENEIIINISSLTSLGCMGLNELEECIELESNDEIRKAQIEKNNKEWTRNYYIINNYSTIIETFLAKNISSKFNNYKIFVNDSKKNTENKSLKSLLKLRVGPTKIASLTLTATSNEGAILTSQYTAKLNQGFEMIWVFPVGLIIPIGTAVVAYAAPLQHDSGIRRVIVEAIDKATQDLAEKLAAQYTKTSRYNQTWDVDIKFALNN